MVRSISYMARFLVFITFFYILGIVLGRYFFTAPASVYLLIGALVWSLLNLWCGREGLQAFIPLLLVFLAVGSLVCNLFIQQTAGNIRQFTGERCTLVGMVGDEPLWREDEVVFPLLPEKVMIGGEEHSVSGMVQVTLHLDNAGDIESGAGDGEQKGVSPLFTYGQEISLRGVLYEPREKRNPGGFDYRAFLETRGIGATFYGSAGDVNILGVSPELSRLRRGALQVKEKMSAVLRAYLPEKEGGLLVGMLFGERRALDSSLEHFFRRSGVAHLLAVSGLHVGLVAGMIFLLGRRLGLKGWPVFLFSAVLLFSYVYITGMRPATLRAFIMFLLGLGAMQLGRKKDLPVAISAAALLTLIYNPLLLFTAAFQLSYAATITIVALAPLLERCFTRFFLFLQRERASRGLPFTRAGSQHEAFSSFLSLLEHSSPPPLKFASETKTAPWPLPYISALVAVTMAAQLGVLPLGAVYFGEVSLVALITNILVLPVMALVLGIGLVAALLGLVLPAAGSIVNLASYPLLVYILLAVEKIAVLPFAYREVFPLSPLEVALYYTGLFSIGLLAGGYYPLLKDRLTPFRSRAKLSHALILFLLVALLFTWWGLPWKEEGSLEVVFLDVGQGDAVFMQTPLGKNIMLDGGGGPAYREDIDQVGHLVLVPFLQQRRIKKLEAIIITHPHDDHYGGFFPVLEKYPVEILVTNQQETENAAYNALLQIAAEKNISRAILQEGDRILLEPSLEIAVLNPPPNRLFSGTGSDYNNNSLVLRLQYKEVSLLFTGDIETAAVGRMLRDEIEMESQVLKVPHHGGYLDNISPFLEAVDPEVAVITVGANPFGHPHPEIQTALEQGNIETYRTDLHGAVTLHTDGRKWELETMLEPCAIP